AYKSGPAAVAYPARAAFNNGGATATLPSGVKASDYCITVLFLDGTAKGGNYAENVTGSFTTSGLAIPSAVSVVYNGLTRTVADLSDADWYDSSIYGNPSNMTVSFPSAIHKGDYTVTFTLVNSDLEWEDGTKTPKSITFSITPKPIGLEWTEDDNGVHSAAPVDDDVCDADQGSTILNTRYRNRSGTADYNAITPPKIIGDYTASAEIVNSDYMIKSGETTTKDFTLPVQKIPVLGAANFDPSNSQQYNGGKRTFAIINYNVYRLKGDTSDASVEISVPERFAGKINFIDNSTFQVTEAGEYALLLDLTDKVNSQWADKSESDPERTSAREVTFTVTKRTLGGMVISGLTNGALKVTEGNNANITLEMIDLPLSTDEISIDVYAYRSGSTNEYLLKSDVKVSSANGYDYNIELNTSSLLLAGNYTVKFELRDKTGSANGNYTLDIDDFTLTLSEESDDGNIVWRLSEGGSLKTSIRTPIGTLSSDFASLSTVKLVYGKEFSFVVTAPSGYAIDTNYNVDGFVNGYKNATATNAGDYTTYVMIKEATAASGTGDTYSITWHIDKATFDLSEVKWKNEIEYTGSNVSPSLEGLPEQIEINELYGVHTEETAVGNYNGDVRVEFKFKDESYNVNYNLPRESDPDSYVNNGTTFSWTISSWEIIPIQIKL
ncbi:MAG: hypothetical protein K2O95_04240, partial [Clostridia bacterium]|nr:hypothetical protein [Clostridia bacterium]